MLDQMPTTTLDRRQVSRLIVGANPILGFSYVEINISSEAGMAAAPDQGSRMALAVRRAAKSS